MADPLTDQAVAELLAEQRVGQPTDAEMAARTVEDERRSTLRQGIDGATRQNPEAARKELKLRVVTPEAQAEVEATRALGRAPIAEIEQSEALTEFMSDPTRAAAVMDDGPEPFAELPIGRLAQAVRDRPDFLQSGPSFGEVQSARSRRGLQTLSRAEAGFRLLFEDSPLNRRELEFASARLRNTQVPEGGFLAETFGAASEQLPLIGSVLGAAGIGFAGGAALGAGATAAIGQIPPLTVVPEEALSVPAGALAGGTHGAFLASMTTLLAFEAGTFYADMIEDPPLDADGNPVDPRVVKGMALAVGMTNAVLARLALGRLLATIPAGRRFLGAATRSGRRKAAERLASNPVVREALFNLGVKFGSAIATESLTEGAQELVAALGENVLRGDPLVPSDAQLDQALAAMGEAARATVVLGGAGVGVSGTVIAGQAVRRARTEKARLEAANAAADDSKLRESNPEDFAALAEKLGAEGGVEQVWVDPADLAQALEAGEIAPDALSQATRDAMAESEQTGGLVPVPIGEFLTRIPGPVRERMAARATLQAESLTQDEAATLESALESLQGAEQAVADGDVEGAQATVEALGTDLATVVTPTEAEVLTEASAKLEDARLSEAAAEQGRREAAQDVVARERRKARGAARKRLKPQVETELANERMWRVRNWLVKGELTLESDLRRLGGLVHRKLDRDAVIEAYGAEFAAELPQNILIRGGVHPEILAELFDYASADDMLLDLANTKGGFATQVGQVTDLRVERELGPETVETPPSDVLEDALFVKLQAEERVLSARLGTKPTAVQVFRRVADAIVGVKPLRELRPGQYALTASRQAALAFGAVKAGQDLDALVAKRREMLNTLLKVAVRKRRAQATRDLKRVRRFLDLARRKRIGLAGGQHLAQVDALLERFELRKSLKATERSQSLARYIAEQEEAGEAVVIPDYLREEAQGMALRTHWRNLTPDQLRDLANSLQNIEHLARLKTTLRLKQQRREQAEIAGELISEAETNTLRPAKPTKRNPARTIDTIRTGLRSVDASLSQVEFVVDALGGNNPLSVWRQAIFERVADARGQFNAMHARFNERLSQMMNTYEHSTQREMRRTIATETRLHDPRFGTHLEVNRWNLILAALNLGNASNKAKLLGGYGWDESTLMDVLSAHLTDADWVFVQRVWNLLDALWPAIAAMEERLSGVVPPKIRRIEFTSPTGRKMRGGYFPVVHDPTRSVIAEKHTNSRLYDRQPGGAGRASTGHSWTETRTTVQNRSILLSPTVVSAHLHDVILDLTHREVLLDVQRLLDRPDVTQTIEDTLGREFNFQNFWLPWLQGIAGEGAQSTALKFWENAARTVRINASVFKLGARLSTLAMQAGGHFNGYRMLREAVPELSNAEVASFWLRGVWRATKDMGSGKELSRVLVESETMRDRVRNYDRDAREAMRQAQIDHKLTDAVREFAMGMIGRVQLLTVDYPIWLSARSMAMQSMGLNEVQAARFADSVVRKSQGSGELFSQSAVMRGGRNGSQYMKAATLFYTYNNVVYNQLRSAGRIATVAHLPSFLAAYAFYVILPEVFAEAVRSTIRMATGREPDERDSDEQRRRDAANAIDILIGGAVATIPIVREAYGPVIALVDPTQRFRADQTTAFSILQEDVGRGVGDFAAGTGEFVAGRATGQDAARMLLGVVRVGAVSTGAPADWVLSLLDRAVKEQNR